MQRALSTAVLSFPQSFLAFPQRPFTPPYISLNLHLAKYGILLLSPPFCSMSFSVSIQVASKVIQPFAKKLLRYNSIHRSGSLGHVFSVCFYSFRRAVAFVKTFLSAISSLFQGNCSAHVASPSPHLSRLKKSLTLSCLQEAVCSIFVPF